MDSTDLALLIDPRALVVPDRRVIPAMSDEAVAFVRALENQSLATRPQNKLRIEHDVRDGMYQRTMYVDQPPPGMVEVVTGALMKVPTLLIWQGEALIFIGEDAPLHVRGYGTMRAAAGRKQAFTVLSEFRLTMVFPTTALTADEAEREFTNEYKKLIPTITPNHITITGE